MNKKIQKNDIYFQYYSDYICNISSFRHYDGQLAPLSTKYLIYFSFYS